MLLFIHSIVRWLVLISLVYSIYRAFKGCFNQLKFSKVDNLTRHWTVTIAHVQLVLGILLYTQSPIILHFWKNIQGAMENIESTFFSLIHTLSMLLAIVLLTIGSALTKRKSIDNDKFKTMFVYFLVALFIILIAIPWPFSPLANRPFIR